MFKVSRCGAGTAASLAARSLCAKLRRRKISTFAFEDFAVGRIIDAITPRSILMIAIGGAPISTFGGLAGRAAKMANAAGIIIDGGCRDVEEVADLDLWLASRHVTPLTGKRRLKVEAIGEPIEMAGVGVGTGDVVIADATGIVVVPAARFEEIAEDAERLHRLDRIIDREIASGQSFATATSAVCYM